MTPCAITRAGGRAPCSRALRMLLERCVIPHLGTGVICKPDVFRRERLYTRDVEAVLRNKQALWNERPVRARAMYIVNPCC